MFNRDDTKRRLEARVRELEAERKRLRDAIAGFGEALAATHDTEQLQRVIVDTAIEAVGAKGGMLVPASGAVVQVGDLSGDQRLQLPLTASRQNFGTLILIGDEFPTEDRLTATSFAAHAVVALENARLHRLVERQALIDGLTGLANRRQSEDALATEISRAARFDNTLTVVLADLDDFKALNDRYGIRREMPSCAPSPGSSGRRFAMPTSRGAGAARSSCSFCPAPTTTAGCCSPSGSARPSPAGRS